MSDIEIARNSSMRAIGKVPSNLGIPDSAIISWGKTKAK
jgi:formyltetrahydrofolate synthetase